MALTGHGCQRAAAAALFQPEAGLLSSRRGEKEEKSCQPPNLGRMSDGHDGGSTMMIKQLAAAVLTTLLCGATDTAASPTG